MKIALITKLGHFDSGVSRYTQELEYLLSSQGYEVVRVHPIVPFPLWFLRFVLIFPGWDLGEFFNNYPIWIKYPEADIYHFVSQNLATIMHFRKPPGPTLVTVHDLIPWTLRDDSKVMIHLRKFHIFFEWLALKGVSRIEWIITNSYKTAGVLINELNNPPSIIKTMHLEID